MSDSISTQHRRGRRPRGWRWLAAALAALMVASVLSVTAGVPAQAANTSGEELIDSNKDGTKDAREFAGSNRYNTALALASRYADDNGGVSSLIVASGEAGGVDALAAASLAGSRSAPLLLTLPDRLPFSVSRFIDAQNITQVTIVGGTAAVSDKVKTTIEGLGSKPTVTRIAGADRYATATTIAGELGTSAPTWCGSNQRAALLVNGGPAGRADAIVAGPLANRLGLPLLLTRSDELPEVTRAYLVDNRVERVVIIGGTAAVSADLANSLIEQIGVTAMVRIAGRNAAETSVMVAKEMLGDACRTELNTDQGRVALVNRDATNDGLAASPVLGRGLGTTGTGAIPILLVGDSLPAAVRDYLASTKEVNAAGNKTHLSILAIGGTAVVSEAVMKAAIDAAKTSGDLTATIGFDPKKASQFTVTFSDVVKGGTTTATNATVENPDMYRINSRRLSASSNETVSLIGVAGLGGGRAVTVKLSHPLKNGDVVVVEGGAKVGANNDMRKLKGAQKTISIPTTPPSTAAPEVEIIATAGQDRFSIIVSDSNLIMSGSNPYTVPSGVRVLKGSAVTASWPAPNGPATYPVTWTSLGNPAAGVTPAVTGQSRNWTLTDAGGAGRVTPAGTQAAPVAVNRPSAIKTSADAPNTVFRYTLDLDQTERLQPGSIIEVARGTFLDKTNRGNRLTRHTVAAPSASFGIKDIYLGNPISTSLAGNTLWAGTATADSGNPSSPTVWDDLRITAKAEGVAAGSAGNGWRVLGYRLPSASNTKPVDIAVNVDTRGKVISYTIRNGDPSRGDLSQAFLKSAAFSANFTFDYGAVATGQTAPTSDTDLAKRASLTAKIGTPMASFTLGGGKSAVAARVEFNDTARNVSDAAAGTIARTLANRGAVWPADANRGIAFYVMRSARERSIWITWESDEQPYTTGTGNSAVTHPTKLPTRSGLRLLATNNAVENYYGDGGTGVGVLANTCGPYGVAQSGGSCATGLSANGVNSDALAQAFIRTVRLDASLKPFSDAGFIAQSVSQTSTAGTGGSGINPGQGGGATTTTQATTTTCVRDRDGNIIRCG